jgi:hypothetical protein
MKTLYRVALSMLPNMSLKKAQALLAIINGDISLLFQAGIEKEIPQLSEAILSELKSGQALRRAEEELNFYEQKLHLAQRFGEAGEHAAALRAMAVEHDLPDEVIREIRALEECIG